VRRGEVYWVALDPAIGGEITKTRPGVILSNDVANRVLNRVIMVPLTSSTQRLMPGEALVSLRGNLQKAMASQLRTVSKERLGNFVGELSPQDIGKVERAVLLQLGIRNGVTTP